MQTASVDMGVEDSGSDDDSNEGGVEGQEDSEGDEIASADVVGSVGRCRGVS